LYCRAYDLLAQRVTLEHFSGLLLLHRCMAREDKAVQDKSNMQSQLLAAEAVYESSASMVVGAAAAAAVPAVAAAR
jgi:hypothetical protein